MLTARPGTSTVDSWARRAYEALRRRACRAWFDGPRKRKSLLSRNGAQDRVRRMSGFKTWTRASSLSEPDTCLGASTKEKSSLKLCLYQFKNERSVPKSLRLDLRICAPPLCLTTVPCVPAVASQARLGKTIVAHTLFRLHPYCPRWAYGVLTLHARKRDIRPSGHERRQVCCVSKSNQTISSSLASSRRRFAIQSVPVRPAISHLEHLYRYLLSFRRHPSHSQPRRSSNSMYLLSALLRPLPFSLSFLSPVLVLLLSLPLVPSALAIPASEQFALSTQTQASACFIKCHNEFCDIHDMPGNTKNFPSAITINCGLAVSLGGFSLLFLSHAGSWRRGRAHKQRTAQQIRTDQVT